MSRSRSRSRSRTGGSGINRRGLLLGLIAGGAGALSIPPILAGGSRTPTISRNAGDQAAKPPAGPSGSGGSGSHLVIARNDVTFMNRIFRERTHEVAYCGLTDDDQLQPWLADTVSADESAATFTVDNCPSGADHLRGTIHTHPDGQPVLSSMDVATLQRSNREFMCVQSGPVTTSVGASPDRLRCYRLAEGSPEPRVRSIRLVVAPADGSGGRIMVP